MNLEFGIENFQSIKLGIHCVQSALILFTWILEIVVFRNATAINAETGWYFGLCFLTIPAIIYLTMTVRYPQTRKYANPYALATVDGIYCIMWLTGFAAQASYNHAETGTGKDEKRDCTGACGASSAIVGLGVIIWLLWVVTFVMSCAGVFIYKRDGYLPGVSRAPFNAQQIDPHKDAFSTAPGDDEYAPIHTNEHEHEIPDTTGGYGGGAGSYSSRHDQDLHPPGISFSGGYVPPRVDDEESGYGDGYGAGGAAGGRVQFPEGRYEHVQVI